jgi:hypothetical protein
MVIYDFIIDLFSYSLTLVGKLRHGYEIKYVSRKFKFNKIFTMVNEIKQRHIMMHLQSVRHMIRKTKKLTIK